MHRLKSAIAKVHLEAEAMADLEGCQILTAQSKRRRNYAQHEGPA